ncbi:MAG: AAA family ATPase [Fervidicoccaceae archaeon]
MNEYEVLSQKIYSLRNSLNQQLVEREKEVTAAISALISGEPAVFISPPGTGKTKLVELLSMLISAKYFYYLLTKFTEPDELIGPIDVAALRKGRYVRITRGRLPEAEVIFLDEIFRSSSAIRNFLLDIILYKRVFNGSEYIRAPILTIYTATNEVSLESEDAALYDRLTIRDFHGNVGFDSWRKLLEKGILLETNQYREVQPILTSEEIRRIQEIVKTRARELISNDSFINKYMEVLAELKSSAIELSDRRKVKTLIVASAISFIYRESTVSLDSLGDAIRLTAPSTEDEVKKVEEVLAKVGLSSYDYKIRQIKTLEAELSNIISRTRAVPAESNVRALDDVLSKSELILERASESRRLESYSSSLREKVIEARNLISKLKEEQSKND